MDRIIGEQEQIRIDKLDFYKEIGVNPFTNGYKPDSNSKIIFRDFEKYSKEELEENTSVVSIAGRLMAKRGQGKAGFATVKDNYGEIQIYINSSNLDEIENKVWSKIDLGDIIFISGEVMKTKVGALAIRVKKLVMLTKSLRPLPEKFHGLIDKEERYRRRYLDLITNDHSKEVLTKRSHMVSELRTILSEKGFLEVETPILQTVAGGASASPFTTHHNTLDIDMYLRIATELHLKRLIVGGYDKVYEIGRLFRNEGMSIKHNPEFTTIELYEAYGDMQSMMQITQEIITKLCLSVNSSLQITFGETNLDLSNFEKIHMVDLINKVTNVNFHEITEFEQAVKIARENNIILNAHHFSVGHIINEFFEQKCEETLIQPTFVYGHPIEISPLSRVDESNSRFTERFELFIDKREYANAFSELNDPLDQLVRFKNQIKELELGNDEANLIDYDFVEALEFGMPPTGGLGIGIDRLVMLLTDSASIRDVLFFPTMKLKN